MDLSIFRILAPDRRIAQPRDVDLGAGFDFADPTRALRFGYWAKLSGGVYVSDLGAEGDPTDTPFTFPVLAGSERQDARQSLKVTVGPVVPYEFETTRYNSATAFSPGDPLTAVAAADAVHNRGILDVATTGQLILARVLKAPVAEANGLIAVYLGPHGHTV